MFKKRIFMFNHVWACLGMFKACLQSLIMLNMQSTVKLHFFGTFPYRMAALERTHYQGGRCDSRPGAGDGCRAWYTCPWTMDWSEYYWTVVLSMFMSCFIYVQWLFISCSSYVQIYQRVCFACINGTEHFSPNAPLTYAVCLQCIDKVSSLLEWCCITSSSQPEI